MKLKDICKRRNRRFSRGRKHSPAELSPFLFQNVLHVSNLWFQTCSKKGLLVRSRNKSDSIQRYISDIYTNPHCTESFAICLNSTFAFCSGGTEENPIVMDPINQSFSPSVPVLWLNMTNSFSKSQTLAV